MPINPLIALGVRAPNAAPIIQDFTRGVHQRRQQGVRNNLAHRQENRQQQAHEFNVEQAQQKILQAGKMESALESARDMAAIGFALDNDDLEGAGRELLARKERLIAKGLPTNQTDAQIEKLRSGDIDAFKADVARENYISERTGLLKAVKGEGGFALGPGQARFDAQGNEIARVAPKSDVLSDEAEAQKLRIAQAGKRGVAALPKNQFGGQQTVQDEDGNLFFATTVRNPRTGTVETALAPMTEGQRQEPVGQVKVTGAYGQTGEQRIGQVGSESGAKVRGKGASERLENAIVEGVDAAQGAAVLHRALGLLNSVETGGYDAAALRAKQFFGVESADEAELSASLGKAVLSQLRTTFGAQFTEREGARLERIEAGFGKSTAGNKRLLQQTLSLVERASRRGIRAAEEVGDENAANDIRELLKFRLVYDDAPSDVPAGVDPEDWKHMTEEERKLFQ